MPKDVVTLPAEDLLKFASHLERLLHVIYQTVPYDMIPENNQSWYQSEQWQQWEQAADKDIIEGKVKSFSSMDALIADLDV